MDNVAFPEYVETFIAATNGYLASFEAKLDVATENLAIEARHYQISTRDGSVDFVVHRTSRSFNEPVGEYRARVCAPLKPDFAEFLRGKEADLNRFATLGALVTTEKDASVLCQCLIQPDFIETTAGVLAAASICARPSILESLRRAFSEETAPVVEKLSAWTDLDFEQLQYDYAHLGVSELGRRGIAIRLYPYGELLLDAVHNNPSWGGGLLCRSFVPASVLAGGESPIDINALNLWGNLVSDAPTFGGWCRVGEDVVFAQFIPNFMKGLPNFNDLLIDWARSRLGSVKQLVDLARESEKQCLAG